MKRFLSGVLVLVTAFTGSAADAPKSVTVRAGTVDRRDTVAVFATPEVGQGPRGWQLRDGGAVLPVQLLPGGKSAFVLPELKAGESKTYVLEPAVALGAQAPVEAQREGTAVSFRAGGREVVRYNGDKTPLPAGFDPAFARGGYLYPVHTPSGTLVADDYPPKHKHHHGIWSPWTKTEFEGRKPDFWNMGDKTGTVEFVELVTAIEGPVAAWATAKHRFIDLSAKPQPKAVLDETWDVVVYPGAKGDRPYNMFDLTSNQKCATDQPLVLPKYHYGGLGFRGHRSWDGKENCEFLTSEGKTRANGNETRGRWVYVYGKVDGKTAGVAILSHPSNFRSPQPLRLHPTEPFACFAPQQLGEFKIEPGKPYTSRYRFVAMDGAPDKVLLERLWNDYATPPEVTAN